MAFEGEGKSSGLSRRVVAANILLAVIGAAKSAEAEIVKDQYGGTVQKICPWAYFPCIQDGIFCFRPIYCEGKFSPEGSMNAAIIFTGILAPAYSIWRRKAGLDPDPNTIEGQEYYKKKYGVQERTPTDRPLSRFFGKPKNTAAPSQPATPDLSESDASDTSSGQGP